uniref:Pilus assembly protein n=1 Tax=Desulfobacca acetoxidans TaxID=60893 RepID=A0A7C3UXT5_9BACT
MKAIRLKNQQGAAVVEFALLAPLFVALLFGVVEFGLSIYSKEVITNASREGARFGVVYCSPRKTAAQIKAQVQDYLTKAGFTDAADITVSPDPPPSTSGSPLTVSVKYPYNFQVLPQFVGGLLGTVTLQANTVMLME